MSRSLFALLALSLIFSGSTRTAVAEKVDFATQVMPIFESRCVKCHKEGNAKGDLKMDTVEALKEVVEIGTIFEGEPDDSELYTRLILPDDDKMRMPKGGKPLEKEQIELIKNWIAEGALLTSADKPAEEKPAMKEEPKAEKKVAPADDAAIGKLQAAGASVVSLYAGSPMLSIGFPSQPGAVNDATVDLIAAVAPNVAWLDLGGTKVTDAGVKKLAALENLSRLHLEQTATTDASADALAGLKQLEYLNLYGTKVTDATLNKLQSLPSLKRLYVWQTAVSFDAAQKAMTDHEGLEVNLGWDHPGVVKQRLETELARVKKSKEEADATIKKAEKELADAKKEVEDSAKATAEIEKQLKKLTEGKKDDAKKEEPKKDEKK